MATDPSMKTQTHYARLGLARNAPPVVIRAAYKALASTYYSDNSLELATAERAAWDEAYSDLQWAFDVLNDEDQKAAYDAELTRNDGGVTGKAPAFHHVAQSALTTQEWNNSMRARAQQRLQDWRVLREKRQEAEACLSVAELESLVQIWRDLENETAADPPMKARCAILAYEYRDEISNLTPTIPVAVNHCPVTPNARTKSNTAVSAPSPNPSHVASRSTRADISPALTPSSRLDARTAERKRAEEMRAEQAKARAEARKEKKAQIEAAKQTELEKKAAVVRADKEKQKALAEGQARAEAERIAKVRAKLHGVPIAVDTADNDFVVSGVQGDSLSHGVDVSDEGL